MSDSQRYPRINKIFVISLYKKIVLSLKLPCGIVRIKHFSLKNRRYLPHFDKDKKDLVVNRTRPLLNAGFLKHKLTCV